MKEIITIDVEITDGIEVKGKSGEAVLVFFDGIAYGQYFHGTVLPGGIDTQKELYGTPRKMSARYILKGQDIDGNDCMIFIENNGSFPKEGTISTTPQIFTDSEALAWLEEAELKGEVVPGKDGVRIHIYEAGGKKSD